MNKFNISVPSLGESISEATIAKWYKKEGETIDKEEIILELETDKVTQEIYAPEKGVILKILFQEGQEVKIGDKVAEISKIPKAKEEVFEKNQETEIRTKKNNKILKIIIPSLGESITKAMVGKWLINENEYINKGDPLVEIETDKVTQELYAEESGILHLINYRENEEVEIGEVIGEIIQKEDKRKASTPDVEVETITSPVKKVASEIDPTIIKRSGKGNKINVHDLKEFLGDVSLSPSARKHIKDKNINILEKNIIKNTKISKSYLIEKDISKAESYVGVEKSTNISDKRKPLSKLRKSIAKRLKEAQNNAAMLSTFNEIDMQNIINLRNSYKKKFLEKYNVKLGFMSFFVKATTNVLKDFPEINSEIDGDDVIYKDRYDINIAVGTEKGLFVPVLRNADNLTFAEIERKINEYGISARTGKLTSEDMRDGTFTISNGGVYGSMLSTPILNPPQSGILGLHNIVKRPIVLNDEIVIRPIMFVALTYDHRIVDGKGAVTFLVKLKEMIEDPERLLLEV